MALNEFLETGYCIIGSAVPFLGPNRKDPTFIVGSGRCGTSLLIQILNSHRQLSTFPGEANNLWHPKCYPYRRRSIDTPPILEDPERFSTISFENWPREHAQRIRNTLKGYHILRGLRKGLIVKSAMISFLIPEILTIFPEAKFLHIFRSGPPVVESLVVKEWEKYIGYFPNKSAFRSSCAKYWNDCILEIEKQRAQLRLDQKGMLLEMSYEELCENPPAALKRLGEFLQIKPDEFKFDTSKIISRNFKAGDFFHDEAWAEALSIMSAAMELKGYAVPAQPHAGRMLA